MIPAPKRRWFQFRLRTIFVVVTLLCVALAITLHRFRARRAAIRDIYELGGGYGVELKGPAWLRQLVGDDKYFYEAHWMPLPITPKSPTNSLFSHYPPLIWFDCRSFG